jgi:hypothetical protein
MLRKFQTLPRFLATLFIVAAALGCDSDQVRKTDDQVVGGVRPTFLFIELTANKTSITAGEEEKPIKLTVRVLFADTGQPASGTVNLTTTLGHFDAPGGPTSLGVLLENGVGSADFFPGESPGTARVRASFQGAIDQISIQIRPFVEPVPPPTAASLTLATDTSVVSEEDDPATIIVTATVVGSNAEPFENAPVQFSAPLGMFASSLSSASEILTTDADGEVSDDLNITAAEMQAFPTDTFEITATLFMEGGAQTSTSVTITIIRADAPPTPTSIVLSAAPTTVQDDDDAGDETVTLTAVVRDQNGALMAGVDVTFNADLGAAPGAQTDGSGEAVSTLTVGDDEITAFPNDTFEVEAVMGVIGGTASDTVTITIIRPAPPTINAEFTSSDSTPCNGGAGSVVQFTDTSTGPVTTWAWDLDGDGTTDDANVPNPVFDYTGFADGVAVNVTLTVTDGGSLSDTVVHQITPAICP